VKQHRYCGRRKIETDMQILAAASIMHFQFALFSRKNKLLLCICFVKNIFYSHKKGEDFKSLLRLCIRRMHPAYNAIFFLTEGITSSFKLRMYLDNFIESQLQLMLQLIISINHETNLTIKRDFSYLQPYL
jgi:hypothetical protein